MGTREGGRGCERELENTRSVELKQRRCWGIKHRAGGEGAWGGRGAAPELVCDTPTHRRDGRVPVTAAQDPSVITGSSPCWASTWGQGELHEGEERADCSPRPWETWGRAAWDAGACCAWLAAGSGLWRAQRVDRCGGAELLTLCGQGGERERSGQGPHTSA